jgi:acyl-CoA synthetase (NDP forming)
MNRNESPATASVRKTLSNDCITLSEAESKVILAGYGIPVIKEIVAVSMEEALIAADKLGFPVVVKGLGKALTHKTERGLVRLNIMTQDDLRKAVDEIQTSAGRDLEGFLVQPYLPGKREFVAGLFQDPNFGPVIMFGVGGIYTEVFNDVCFGLAPLERVDMDQMLSEIKAAKLLDDFRGERHVSRDQLRQVLGGLSRLAMDRPEIQEVDINPLVVSNKGDITAVDALVVLAKTKPQHPPSVSIDPMKLGPLFYPRSVAFIGASATIGKWGHMLVTNTLSGGYDGKVYLVNPKTDVIADRKVYKTIADIDGTIDLAVVSIPANFVLDLIPELEKKGTRGMLLITSGFRETGERGRLLEEQLVSTARRANILILGPNTMGVCNPHSKFFCYSAHVHPLPGSTTLVSQSGNMGVQLLSFAEMQNIGIRAFSGSGNEAMVTIEDYMEAFEVDELTRTVVMYLESVKDGRRFFDSARRVARQKPIVVLKGGRTEVGSRAASSHTGALASNTKVFDAACRQAGIVQVKKPMELLDLSAVFSSLPLPRGNRVAIMTLGGGWGVVTADLCAQYGLALPQLSKELLEEFDAVLPDYWSRSNPVDIVGERDSELPLRVIEKLMQWDGCDAVIHLGIEGRRIFVNKMADSIARCDSSYSKEFLDMAKTELRKQEMAYIEFVSRLTDRYEKPVLGVSLITDEYTRTLHRIPDCKYKGVLFPSPERAVKALSGMCQYRSYRDRK